MGKASRRKAEAKKPKEEIYRGTKIIRVPTVEAAFEKLREISKQGPPRGKK